ncbi:MAG TPA: MarR family transcriptional regulator [Pseudolysinimonas sp.]|jgi:DNA-binding MarR family transcriptional regulator
MSESARDRRRAVNAVKEGLRELRTQLAALNHRVGSEASLRDADLDTFDLVARHGPISPSALAKLAGLHPATMTGVLDRLETGGWIERRRDATDRRAIAVSAVPARAGDMLRLFGGMNTAMDAVCDGYDDDQLATISDFLIKAARAGQESAAELVP